MSQEDQVVQTEEEAMSEIMAGYDNTTVRDESPTEVDDEVVDEVVDEAVDEAVDPDDSTEDEQPEATVKSLSDELKDLKARVSASQSDPDTLRRMHGTIGELNRTIQEMKNKTPAPAVEPDEDAAELDEIINDYPELAGPIVKNIKSLQEKLAKLSTVNPDQLTDGIDDRVSSAIQELRRKDAIEALEEEHPDYVTVNNSPEFKKWLSTKPPEYKARLETTWNPAIVSKGLSEFKSSIKKSKEKNTRLASAITPRGVPQKAGTSVLPDEDGLLIGYNSVR